MNRNARTTDPATSHQHQPTHSSRLLAVYADIPEGLTAEQAAAAADLLHTGYWKRVSDLTRDGFIAPTYRDGHPVTARSSSGYQQRVLAITPAGKEQHARHQH